MLDDLKFAWRRLWNAPGFSGMAVLTLALAIGANTAIFSIADAVLFRPLPYQDADQLHVMRMMDRKTSQRFTLVSFDFLRAVNGIHAQGGGLSEVGLLDSAPSVLVSGRDGTESVTMLAATTNYFQVLGVRAARGRVFDASDEGGVARTAVLSWTAWRQRFGGDEHVVGRAVTLGDKTFDIVGVLPQGLMFPTVFGTRPELVVVTAWPAVGEQGGAFLPVIRRDPGVTREIAQARIDAATALSASDPRMTNVGPVLEDMRAVLYPTGRPIMRWLLTASALVWLIGCANLANMLLARSQRRERETALRAALGASRLRLLRPILFESVIIGLAGAALAVVVTAAVFDALLRQVPRVAYGNAPVGVDARVIAITIAMGLVGGLFFSVVPAWRSSRLDVQTLMQARHVRGGKRSGRFGRPMVALQVAVAIVLVFGAVLTGRAFMSVLRVPLGFDSDNVATVSVWPRDVKGAALQDAYVRAIEVLSRRQNVVAAGAAGSMPFSAQAPDESVKALASGVRPAGIVHVLPGYFEAIDVPITRGRSLTWDDVRGGGGAAVVSEAAARAMFADREPLGAIFENSRGRQFTVVGVASNVQRSLPVAARDLAVAYVIPNDSTRSLTLVLRARQRQDVLLSDIKRDIAALAPGAPITVEWWSDQIRAVTAYRNPRFQTIVLGSLAVLALGLTALGIFGVVAFLVATRTREMGVRLAIGATPQSLVAMMVRQSLGPVVVGAILGVFATRALSQFAESQLFEVKAHDPITLAAAVVTVAIAALLAAYLPARQASRVDPIVVLRAE